MSDARRVRSGAAPWTATGRRRELGRKAIHISSLVFPVFVWFAEPAFALAALVAGASIALAVDVARLSSRPFARIFYGWTRQLLRGAERRRFVGATYMMLAYLAAYLIFPLHVAVAAMAYNALGDAFAALVGRRWGRVKIASGKTLEGMTACAAACFAVGLVVPGIGWMAALAAAIVTALIEMTSWPPDDNLWMTLGGGGVLWLVLLTGL